MNFNKYFDHTILSPDATEEMVEKVCKEALEYDFASVCVNQTHTKLVADLLRGSNVKTCTVVGFPLGAASTSVKVFETKEAIAEGATEIDMVINIGAMKDKNHVLVLNDIKKIKDACGKEITLKVILETCLLTEEEKIKACELSVEAGADFVKTSTGFSKSGATVEDVALMKKAVSGKAKVKASGGIRDYQAANKMIEAGADRLGTSATVAIVAEYSK